MAKSKNKIIPLIEITQELVEQKTYVIRGQKVMLDYDLAEIYGYETKRFNVQVKNNIDRFPEDFMFRLNSKEFNNILMSKKSTSSWGGKRKLPNVFTEKGIYMLMTVLKGDLATKQSVVLIRILEMLKDFYIQSESEFKQVTAISHINERLDKQDKRIFSVESKLEIMMKNFNDEKATKHYLILKDQRVEADIAFQQIYSNANNSLIIIDNYVSLKTLLNLKKCKPNVEITICTDNVGNQLSKTEFDDFVKDTKLSIKILENNKTVHDRYIVVDFMTDNIIIYSCGSSSKDSGNYVTTIQQIEFPNLYIPVIENLLQNEEKELKN